MESLHVRKLVAALFAIILGVSALTLSAPSASHAALSSCSSGTACVWDSNDYKGNYMKASNLVNNYKTINWNNTSSGTPNGKANSVANRGSRCAVVFFQDTYHKGAGIRFNRPAAGGIKQDPYLKNGGGYSYTTGANTKNFENKISSHKWVNCA